LSRPTESERLANPDALLSRADLSELGLDAAPSTPCPGAPGDRAAGIQPAHVRVSDYLGLPERSTFAGDRVR
jgi:hypothetical protein